MACHNIFCCQVSLPPLVLSLVFTSPTPLLRDRGTKERILDDGSLAGEKEREGR